MISTWYNTLNRSNLTPPNYVFPVAWTILYAAIGPSGGLIWCKSSFPGLKTIKALYATQIILNRSRTPLILQLPLNRTFSHNFGFDGYSGLQDNLAFLPEGKVGITAYDSIFTLDSVCDLLKFLHMAL